MKSSKRPEVLPVAGTKRARIMLYLWPNGNRWFVAQARLYCGEWEDVAFLNNIQMARRVMLAL